MLTRYREPHSIGVLAWAYHVLVLISGLAGVLAGPPASVEMIGGDDLLIRVLWSSLFLMCGGIGVWSRVRDLPYLEAVAFAGAGLATLTWLVAAVLNHLDGGLVSWQTLSRFAATVAMSFAVAGTRYAYARQRDRYLIGARALHEEVAALAREQADEIRRERGAL